MTLLKILFILFILKITLLSWERQKTGSFFGLTFFLAPLGIYVWGDALVLGPFWLLSGLIFLWLSPINILKYILLFHTLRSAYEVMYWLNHQSVKDSYRPPLPARFNHISPKEAAILYQLAHTCLIFLYLFTLLHL